MDDTTNILGRPLWTEAYKKFLGNETEKKFFDAMESLHSAPRWYLGFRKATYQEDTNGFDAFVLLDIGEAPMNIKRSYDGADKHLLQYPNRDTIIMVVTPNMDEKVIQLKTLFKLESWRLRKISEMRGWRRAWMPLVARSFI